MDAKNLAFPDSFFDAVVAQYVITAVPDPEATLDDFIRVLKPGGELILVNHIGAESGPRRIVRTGVRAAGAPARLAAGISLGAAGQLGREARRRHPDRAPADAADGAFLADPLPQVLKSAALSPGTSAAAGRLPGMRMKPHCFLCVRADGGVRPGGRAGAADAGDAAGANRAAAPRARRNCAPMQPPPHRARRRRTEPPPASAPSRSATNWRDRTACCVRRRHRPGNPRADARCRQYAGDSAARQPRRRPHDPPEIATLCRHLAEACGFA